MFIKAYSYLSDILYFVKNNMRISIDEFNIVGGRISGKSYAVETLFLLLTLISDRVALYCARVGDSAINELFDEFSDVADEMDITIRSVKSKKLVIYSNNNKIRFYSVSKNKNNRTKASRSGIARAHNVDYIFIFFEERYEFSETEHRSIIEAIRGDASSLEAQIIIFNVANPWGKGNEYIKYLDSLQPWDINKLKTTGSQIGIYERNFKETFYDENNNIVEMDIKKRILVHYTNWRVCQKFLSKSQIANILDTWNIDRNRAKTVDYGLAGYESTAIYTHELHKIGNCIYTDHNWLFGGGDYGWSSKASGGKTVFIFGGASLESGIDIYDEYFHDNAKQPKSTEVLVAEVVEFYERAIQNYCRRINRNDYLTVNVRVDNMNKELILMLNRQAQKRGYRFLKFISCRKYPIQDRIVFLLSMLSKQMFRMNPTVKQLRSDLEMSSYEESDVQKRKKEFDHALNALEYGCESFMYPFAKINNASMLKKNSKRDYYDM